MMIVAIEKEGKHGKRIRNGEQTEYINLNRMIREDLSRKVIFEKRPEDGGIKPCNV